ncbi:MAG: PAS domain S-box protein, partial [Deltaproteobacteria bacterium]
DNNALDLLAENPQTLFPGTPVVFCGINDYKPALHATRPDVTGVVEYGDFSDTLKIAFKARPNATKLYIISDHTETGEINTRDLLAVLSSLAPGPQAVLTDRISYEELSTTLQTAAPQHVAFFVSFWKDGTGRNIEPFQLEAVFRKSAIPVFGRSEWMINHGMVGGKCVTGFAQGEAGARIALQILGGTPVSALPVDTNSPNQYLFDHRMMQRYLIDEDIFPDESIGFNRPEAFYRVSKPVGATVLVFSALLLAALFFLVVNINQRRQALLALRKATASLEQSESCYRGMIENIQDTFYRTDAQGFIIFISPSGARLLGYDSPQKMVGLPVASLWNFPAERSDMLEIM